MIVSVLGFAENVTLAPDVNVIVSLLLSATMLVPSNAKVLNTPALISDKVIDTIGAGDVFLVITSLLYSVKSDQLVTNIIGNIAGALKVDILGHSKSISRSNFYAVLNHILK